MAYIIPNSTMMLYSGVELDNEYINTFYFGDEQEREDMFGANSTAPFKQNIVAILDGESYLSKEKNKFRVHVDKMKLWNTNKTIFDINYMRFKNTQYENKWFYAFVNDAEYVNDELAELTFEIDVMTTFRFDYELETSFIEREHVRSDSDSEKFIPESLETGDYVFSKQTMLKPLEYYNVFNTLYGEENYGLSLILVTNDSFISDPDNPPSVSFNRKSGLPTSMNFHAMRNYYYKDQNTNNWVYADNDALQAFYNSTIKPYVDAGKTDALLGLYIVPEEWISTSGSDPFPASGYYQVTISNKFQTYEPFNNKLQSYPYKMVYGMDIDGNNFIYRIEHFLQESVQFRLITSLNSPPGATFIPLNYKNLSSNFDEAVSISSFPSIALVTDSFKQWVAENGYLTMLNGIKGAIGGVETGAGSAVGMALGSKLTAATGAVNLIGSGLNAALSIETALAKFQQAEIRPNDTVTFGNANALTAGDIFPVQLGVKEITEPMARVIDNYFTKYGYASHRVAIPNRKNRSRWTYLKTVGCCVKEVVTQSGHGVPQTYLSKIANIYDNGITHWVVSEKGNVGNYNQWRATQGSEGRINEALGNA